MFYIVYAAYTFSLCNTFFYVGNSIDLLQLTSKTMNHRKRSASLMDKIGGRQLKSMKSRNMLRRIQMTSSSLLDRFPNIRMVYR